MTGIYDTVQNGTDQLVDIVGGGAQFALDAAGNVYVLVTDVIGNTFTTLGKDIIYFQQERYSPYKLEFLGGLFLILGEWWTWYPYPK